MNKQVEQLDVAFISELRTLVRNEVKAALVEFEIESTRHVQEGGNLMTLRDQYEAQAQKSVAAIEAMDE